MKNPIPRRLGASATPAFNDAGETLHPPARVDGRWVVRVVDTVMGVEESRAFPSAALAWDFYTMIMLARSGELEAVGADQHIKHTVDSSRPATDLAQAEQLDGRARSRSGGVNLRAVGETLAGYGLDPSAEISEILMPHDEVDPDGVTRKKHALDPRERAKALLELMQYVHPKLKAIEVTQKVDELTEQQVDAKLTALLAKALKRGD